MRQFADAPHWERLTDEPYFPATKGVRQNRKRRHTKPIVTRRDVSAVFDTVFESEGLPVDLWRRDGVILLAGLCKPMREAVKQRWGVRPTIIEGDTLGEAIAKTLVRVREGQP